MHTYCEVQCCCAQRNPTSSTGDATTRTNDQAHICAAMYTRCADAALCLVGVTAVHMQVFNNMASSGLVTRKFTRYRTNTRESTSYMVETVCQPARSESRMFTCGAAGQFASESLEIAVLYFQPKTESYRNRIVSMRSVSNFLLEFENKSAVSFV